MKNSQIEAIEMFYQFILAGITFWLMVYAYTKPYWIISMALGAIVMVFRTNKSTK